MIEARTRRLGRAGMLKRLDEIEQERGQAVSVYLPGTMPLPEIERTLRATVDVPDLLPELAGWVSRSRTGAVVFWGAGVRCLILPPFPVAEAVSFSGYDAAPLRSVLTRDLVLALVLVRLGAYAIGVFRGENLISSKVGTGLVHARHKKGGSSQRRFERRREKEVTEFFDRVCERAREHLGPHSACLDYIVYGGERNTLSSFRKRCRMLSLFDDRALPRVLNVREPRQATLESACGEVWTSQVVTWPAEGWAPDDAA